MIALKLSVIIKYTQYFPNIFEGHYFNNTLFDNAQISQKELIQIIKDLWFFVFLNNNIELQI